jgi:hypothetical protein
LHNFLFPYQQGIKEFPEICSEICDRNRRLFNRSVVTVKHDGNEKGLQWHQSQGSQEKPIQPEVEKVILELSALPLKRGVKKIHATLLLPKYDSLGTVKSDRSRKRVCMTESLDSETRRKTKETSEMPLSSVSNLPWNIISWEQTNCKYETDASGRP